MSFVEKIQSGKGAKTPTQTEFDADEWASAFAASNNGSLRDERLYTSGIWCDARLADIRRHLADVVLPGGDSVTAIRLFVGFLNLTTGHVQDAGGQMKPVDAGSTATRVLELAPTVDLGAKLTALLQGARWPIAALLTGRIPWQTGDSVTDLDLIKALGYAQLLGNAYGYISDRWADCLWEDWYVDQIPKADVVRPDSLDDELAGAVSAFRTARLGNALRLVGVRRWNRMSLEDQRRAVGHLRVKAIKKRGRHRVIELGEPIGTTHVPPTGWSARLILDRFYPREALAESITAYHGLSVSQLVDAWDVLVPLGLLLQQQFVPFDRVKSSANFLECAPTFRCAELEGALTRALDFTPDQAQMTVELFTYHGRPRERISERPLIPAQPGHVTVIPFTLVWANLVTVAESWIRVDPHVVSRRGREHEAGLRSRLREILRLPTAQVFPKRLMLPSKTDEEELDLVVRVGHTIAVAEVKCVVQPASAVDRHNYQRVLEEAADQARRKAQAVLDNVDAFVARSGFTLPVGAITVLPIVVTNLAEGVGSSIAGVPVVDSLLLEEFLGAGVLRRPAGLHLDTGTIIETLYPLYDSPATAESGFGGYLNGPPELAEVRRFTETIRTPLWTSSAIPKPAVALDFRVTLPLFRLGRG